MAILHFNDSTFSPKNRLQPDLESYTVISNKFFLKIPITQHRLNRAWTCIHMSCGFTPGPVKGVLYLEQCIRKPSSALRRKLQRSCSSSVLCLRQGERGGYESCEQALPSVTVSLKNLIQKFLWKKGEETFNSTTTRQAACSSKHLHAQVKW